MLSVSNDFKKTDYFIDNLVDDVIFTSHLKP